MKIAETCPNLLTAWQEGRWAQKGSGSGWLHKIKQKLLMTERESAQTRLKPDLSGVGFSVLFRLTCHMQLASSNQQHATCNAATLAATASATRSKIAKSRVWAGQVHLAAASSSFGPSD